MRRLTDDSPNPDPTPYDPRNIETRRQGTPIRDAAVDPDPDDFLAPTNAGEANPHGPDVVSPGIHGLETKPVLPGDVADVDRQEERETELADRTLVHDEPVPDVVEEMAEGAYDTKVDAADPAAEENTTGQARALADAPAASGAEGDAAPSAREEDLAVDADPDEAATEEPQRSETPADADAPDAEEQTATAEEPEQPAPKRPQRNDSTAKWREYAVNSGVLLWSEADELGRDEIIARVDATEAENGS